MKRFEGPIILFVFVAAVTIVIASQNKDHGGRPLTTTLSGAAEIPGPGDTDGAGTFKATFNSGQGQICYELNVSNIATPTAAHIHSGGPTVAGPVVLQLKTPVDGSAKECADLSKEQVQAIIQKPGDFYVNVHNADFPNGAIRGQLSK